MKLTYAYAAAAIAVTFGLAACIPSAEPNSAPTAAPVATPAPEPTRPVLEIPSPAPGILPPAIAEDWLDQPQTAGDWEYARERSETFAIFGTGREAPTAIIRCDLNTRNVGIGVFLSGQRSQLEMHIVAETADRRRFAETRESAFPLYAAAFPANDPLLDAIALTRGRFAVAIAGKPVLHLPAWGEVTRVIEDCR